MDEVLDLQGVEQIFPPQIGIRGFGDSSIDIGIRHWVQTHRYYHTQYAANLAVIKNLVAGGIKIPYPRREVQILRGD